MCVCMWSKLLWVAISCPHLQEYADKVRKALREDELGERLQIEFNSEHAAGWGLFRVHLFRWLCIQETHWVP